MIKNTLVVIAVIILSSMNVYAKEFKNIEIFSINQEKVVKVVQSNSDIQKLAVSYLKGIEGVYGKFEPIPEEGYAIRIPLDPSVKIQRKGINAVVDQIVVMFPKNEESFLMFFEDENKLVCFTFKGNTDILWNKLEFNPVDSQ